MLNQNSMDRYMAGVDGIVSVEQIFTALKHEVSAEQAMAACRRTRRNCESLGLTEAIRIGQRQVVSDVVNRMASRGRLLRAGGRGMNRTVELPPPGMTPDEVLEARRRVSAFLDEVEQFMLAAEQAVAPHACGDLPLDRCDDLLAIGRSLLERRRELEKRPGHESWDDPATRGWHAMIRRWWLLWGHCHPAVWRDITAELTRVERDLCEFERELSVHPATGLTVAKAEFERKGAELSTVLRKIVIYPAIFSTGTLLGDHLEAIRGLEPRVDAAMNSLAELRQQEANAREHGRCVA